MLKFKIQSCFKKIISKKRNSALLKALQENKYVAFSDFSVGLKIELVACLLNTLVSGVKFDSYLDMLNYKVSNFEAKLKQGESELIEKLGIERSLFRRTKNKYYELASNDKK